jgi:hypothetical protein
MINMKYILTFGIIAVSLAVSIIAIQQQSFATGCPTNFVSEHIKNAKAALQNGTTEEALNQLELAEEAIGVASEENE